MRRLRVSLQPALLAVAARVAGDRAAVARGGVAVEARAFVCAYVGRDAARRVGVAAASLPSAANDGALANHIATVVMSTLTGGTLITTLLGMHGRWVVPVGALQRVESRGAHVHTHSAALGERVQCQSALAHRERRRRRGARAAAERRGATRAASLNRFAPLPINADAVG